MAGSHGNQEPSGKGILGPELPEGEGTMRESGGSGGHTSLGAASCLGSAECWVGSVSI